MSRIVKVDAREILDSRGNPTVEALVVLESGATGIGSTPSGASTGSREALEVRDNDATRFCGKGVLRAVEAVRTDIRDLLDGRAADEQAAIDRDLCNLDGTTGKRRLGANGILAVSIAVARASATELRLPLFRYLGGCGAVRLPMPFFNVINGGAHADNPLDFQEFMVAPVGAQTFTDAVRMGAEVFYALRAVLSNEGHVTNVGDEGGFAPQISRTEDALTLIARAVENTRYRLGEHIAIAIDPAASELYSEDAYHLKGEGRRLDAEQMVNEYEQLLGRFPIISIEDGMAEDDWDGWAKLTKRLASRVQLVGDDLFVTNTELLKRGLVAGIANAILIKPNQIGTLSETIAAAQLALHSNYRCMLSHRSGETEDTSIADLVVALNAGQIKSGALSRSDRVGKYNRLMQIERDLGDSAVFLTG